MEAKKNKTLVKLFAKTVKVRKDGCPDAKPTYVTPSSSSSSSLSCTESSSNGKKRWKKKANKIKKDFLKTSDFFHKATVDLKSLQDNSKAVDVAKEVAAKKAKKTED